MCRHRENDMAATQANNHRFVSRVIELLGLLTIMMYVNVTLYSDMCLEY
jgi:hypothetical protein